MFGDPFSQGERERTDALPGGAAHGEHSQPTSGDLGRDQVCQVTAIRYVNLVEDDHPRPVRQVRGVRGQFGLDDVEVADGITAGLEGGAVQHVHDDRAALDMAQELKPQAASGTGAGDQAWDVGHRVRRKVTGQRHAEVRYEGGEGVVRDFGLGRAEHRDQRGLARAGKAHQRHVRDGLELQDGVKPLPRLAELREPRGLAPSGGKSRVAPATAATAGDDQLAPGADKVRDLLAVRP